MRISYSLTTFAIGTICISSVAFAFWSICRRRHDDVVSVAPRAVTQTAIETGKSCPAGMIFVPAARSVHVGCSMDGFDDLPVDILPFCIDIVEMTWFRYRRCLKAGVCGNPGCAQLGGDTLPTVCIDARDAQAACAFEGKRLPSADEIGYAASGGHCDAWWWDKYLLGTSDDHEIVVVGTRPQDVSPFGVHDLRLNVNEWTSSTEHSNRPYVTLRKAVINDGSVKDAFIVAIDDSTTTPRLGARCAVDAQGYER